MVSTTIEGEKSARGRDHQGRGKSPQLLVDDLAIEHARLKAVVEHLLVERGVALQLMRTGGSQPVAVLPLLSVGLPHQLVGNPQL